MNIYEEVGKRIIECVKGDCKVDSLVRSLFWLENRKSESISGVYEELIQQIINRLVVKYDKEYNTSQF